MKIYYSQEYSFSIEKNNLIISCSDLLCFPLKPFPSTQNVPAQAQISSAPVKNEVCVLRFSATCTDFLCSRTTVLLALRRLLRTSKTFAHVSLLLCCMNPDEPVFIILIKIFFFRR